MWVRGSSGEEDPEHWGSQEGFLGGGGGRSVVLGLTGFLRGGGRTLTLSPGT